MPTIKLEHITKIEGHATLTLRIDKGKVRRCDLGSVEGSRYFEGIVRGRMGAESPEITSRICGICSCAHTVCSIQAIENALCIDPSDQTIELRKLLTLGERIRSHAAHTYFLALPDYLGYESALAMAQKYKTEVQRALKIMRVGNQIVRLIGGRDIHPVSAQVGGFVKLPSQDDLDQLEKDLRSIKQDAIATVKLFAKLKHPDFSNHLEHFSLKDKHEYAMLYGSIQSDSHSFDKDDYLRYLEEYHESYSTANFVVRKGKTYRVGALPRLSNNHDQLSRDAKKALKDTKLKLPSDNPFDNNLAQAIEIVHAIDHALKIVGMKIRKERPLELKYRKGRGIGVIEVPRGTLWHDYTLSNSGKILNANIITPTAQNLRAMQEDVRAFIPSIVKLSKKRLVLEIEKLIRAYDPCFSCSTHFLKVNWR